MHKARLLLAAPTGRAAKRLTEVTGIKATTIHSLLSFDFQTNGFTYTESNPLSCDLIIIDEVSMIDTLLMANLLSAIPSQARLILVGDYDQLPSVGAGTVLKDLLQLSFFEHCALETIFRQSKTSSIISHAHSVRQGQLFSLKHHKESDFFFLPEKDPLKIKQSIIDLVQTRLPKAYGYSVMEDIQVLTPQNKGELGTIELNKSLQAVVNPQSSALEAMGNQFRLQDKVMQLKNNYVKGVFNGDIGRIVSIDDSAETLSVRFDDVEVTYEFTECDELKCAYAATVHKFQGSEYPCIIMPIHMSHYKLLYRQLLYTAITRGKTLVILVGDPAALKIAIEKEDVSRRFTGLTLFNEDASHYS